jgi:metal-sulfur cluster biosynthetic enzyme
LGSVKGIKRLEIVLSFMSSKEKKSLEGVLQALVSIGNPHVKADTIRSLCEFYKVQTA